MFVAIDAGCLVAAAGAGAGVVSVDHGLMMHR
jgi:hypothetical protein